MKSYEAKGVAATQEVQLAARKVAIENSRLRTLLREVGVSEQRIATYLQACENNVHQQAAQDVRYDTIRVSQYHQASLPRSDPQGRSIPLPLAVTHCGHDTSPREVYNHTSTTPTETNSDISRGSAGTCTEGLPETSDSLSNVENDYEQNRSNRSDEVNQNHDIGPVDCPNTSTCFCGPTIEAETPPKDFGLEISCNTAASIIAGMRGDADREAIRASLGCVGDQDCQIKNSTVLQLMDES